ncbi:MAG: hypothetical protein ACRECQ_02675, partial [Burkholderiaceae bacterium]
MAHQRFVARYQHFGEAAAKLAPAHVLHHFRITRRCNDFVRHPHRRRNAHQIGEHRQLRVARLVLN